MLWASPAVSYAGNFRAKYGIYRWHAHCVIYIVYIIGHTVPWNLESMRGHIYKRGTWDASLRIPHTLFKRRGVKKYGGLMRNIWVFSSFVDVPRSVTTT